MKTLLLLFFTFISLNGFSQSPTKDNAFLTISPMVKKTDTLNKEIIDTLIKFLLTKNSTTNEINKYWLASEYKTNIFPYYDIYNIEASRYGSDFYRPTLMEIIPADNENQKIVKLAYIGHNNETNENIVRAVYNIVANKMTTGIIFSMYLNYVTKNWKETEVGSTTYKISPLSCRVLNMTEALKQKKEIAELSSFFGCKEIPINYYSCINPVEVFQIKGFDYNTLMYVDKSGGLNEPGDNIISGNNSDYYMHEVAHSYIGHLFPEINSFLNEGFAMLIGGSGKFNYEWHRNKMKKYLEANPDFSFADHTTNTWEPLFIDKETQITYMLGALVCERTLRLYGKGKLFTIFKSKKPFFETLSDVGLTKENLNQELRKEIKLPLIL
jgi:hypothetical protein